MDNGEVGFLFNTWIDIVKLHTLDDILHVIILFLLELAITLSKSARFSRWKYSQVCLYCKICYLTCYLFIIAIWLLPLRPLFSSLAANRLSILDLPLYAATLINSRLSYPGLTPWWLLATESFPGPARWTSLFLSFTVVLLGRALPRYLPVGPAAELAQTAASLENGHCRRPRCQLRHFIRSLCGFPPRACPHMLATPRTLVAAPAFTAQAFLGRLICWCVYAVPHCSVLAACSALGSVLAVSPTPLTPRTLPRAAAAAGGIGFFGVALMLTYYLRAGEVNYLVGGMLTFSVGFSSLSTALVAEAANHEEIRRRTIPDEQGLTPFTCPFPQEDVSLTLSPGRAADVPLN